jgi:hypothetical protein
VRCWGANDEGQLGNNATTGSLVPVDVAIVATSISSGVSAQHTCASTATGVKCWGSNRKGQLGNGSTDRALVPTDVAGVGPGVLSAGVSHTCVLTIDGAFCWGDNLLGELGSDQSTQSTTPIAVLALGGGSGAKTLGCGSHHCCAALPTQVVCWGTNESGELGDLSTTPSRLPVKVNADLTAVDSIGVGESYSCAQTGGKVTCWGLGAWSAADGTSVAPIDVGGL